MKVYRFYFAFLLFFVACKPKDKAAEAENDIDAARHFIQATLEGKFDQARNYMLRDSVNDDYMNDHERIYQNIDAETKRSYSEATIRIHNVANVVKDSVTIVVYSNSFKNNQDTLKVIRQGDKWLVDLKHLFQHNENSLAKDPAVNDTIR